MTLESLIAARRDALFFYSPYNYLREIDATLQTQLVIDARIENRPYFSAPLGGSEARFYFRRLAWDTDHFGLVTHKLEAVLYEGRNLTGLTEACRAFRAHLAAIGSQHCSAELPAEDLFLIQALNGAGFVLVETRLHYFHRLAQHAHPKRFPVRWAVEADAANLRSVARTMRNDFDRVHADPVYTTDQADNFLAVFVDQALKGFADIVMVPDAPGEAPGAFLAANYLRHLWPVYGIPVARLVLSAVSSARKGWYRKLLSEMNYHLREQGISYLVTNTQATNRASFHTWETLGFQLGASSHVVSCRP